MKLTAIIEKANDGGISIYCNEINGSFGYGLNEDEAKNDFCEVLKEQAEFYFEKHNKYPDWFEKGYEIIYKYDISGFFEAYPFINATKFAKEIGINPSLMRKYKGKIVVASEKQKNIIQEKYDLLVKKLQSVKF